MLIMEESVRASSGIKKKNESHKKKRVRRRKV